MQQHVHKYQRVIDNRPPGYTVYKCIIAGCKHWLRKELMLGREAICWCCGLSMFLNIQDLSMKKPRHYECRRVRDNAIVLPQGEASATEQPTTE